jgi:hypothetical protein
MRHLDQKEYESAFAETSSREEAFRQAVDIRKFEIDLYWKRATYFWTFIGAVFAGFAAVQAIGAESTKIALSVVTSCLGLVFAFSWLCVNRGSKRWQENWEFHTDLLEDRVVGPLYKIAIHHVPPTGLKGVLVQGAIGSGSFSVTRINQIISLYVTVVWVILLWYSLPPYGVVCKDTWLYLFVIGMALAAILLVLGLAQTGKDDVVGIATLREPSLQKHTNAT